MPALRGLAALVFAAGFLIAAVGPAASHVFKASQGVVFFDRGAESYTFDLLVNLEAMLAGIDPELSDTGDSPNAPEYNRLRALPPDELRKLFDGMRAEFLANLRFKVDGVAVTPAFVSEEVRDQPDLGKARVTALRFKGNLLPGAKEFRFGWDPSYGKVIIRTVNSHARSVHVEEVIGGADSDPVVIAEVQARSVWAMILDFLVLGYGHIVPEGIDHIMFVVGIFLLSTRLRPILTQVTAFTLAHTVTLGLGAAGVVQVPPAIVEPLIAASIIYVGVENILTPKLSVWRPAVVFGFGLLHGLGFAAALKDFNMGGDDFIPALLSFNLGVELGQLTVIAGCYLLVGHWFGEKPWYRSRVVIPGSVVIAGVAAVWFLQRVGVV